MTANEIEWIIGKFLNTHPAVRGVAYVRHDGRMTNGKGVSADNVPVAISGSIAIYDAGDAWLVAGPRTSSVVVRKNPAFDLSALIA